MLHGPTGLSPLPAFCLLKFMLSKCHCLFLPVLFGLCFLFFHGKGCGIPGRRIGELLVQCVEYSQVHFLYSVQESNFLSQVSPFPEGDKEYLETLENS